MSPIYRGTRMPSGRPVELSFIFGCPVETCAYEYSYDTREAAITGAVLHARCCGGKAHDELLIDLLAAESPLFGDWLGAAS